MEYTEIYKLQAGETMLWDNGHGWGYWITRIAGGWLYAPAERKGSEDLLGMNDEFKYHSPFFVPFDNEFQSAYEGVTILTSNDKLVIEDAVKQMQKVISNYCEINSEDIFKIVNAIDNLKTFFK